MAVWPEVEAQISERSWITENILPEWPSKWRPDGFSLTSARRAPALGLVEESRVLNGQPVSVWIRGSLLESRGSRTATSRLAAGKRRLYRTFLSWAQDHRLCGDVAESLVDRTLRDMLGRHVWLDPTHKRGKVDSVQGVPIKGGPLDHAGEWALDPSRLAAGSVPFGVEVKNIRAPIYPWSIEAWDLLSKMSAVPDAVPVMVARRIHITTFRFFKDIGALGTELRNQLFASTIPAEQFSSVTGSLGLHNVKRIDSEHRERSVTEFFRATGPRMAEQQRDRWRAAAPIVAAHASYRHSADRLEWIEFCRDIIAAGLYERRGWAPAAAHKPAPFYESPDFDPRDYMDDDEIAEDETSDWE